MAAWVFELPNGQPVCTVLAAGMPLPLVLDDGASIAVTLPTMSAGISAQESLVASLNASLPDLLAAIAAMEDIGGTVAATGPDAQAALAAVETIPGAIAAAGPGALASIAAAETIAATLAASAPNPQATVAAAETLSASVSASGPNAAASIAAVLDVPMTGLLVRVRADQLITLNGANVSAWGDITGHGNNMAQATSGNQPLFLASSLNGKPAVRMTTTGSKFLLGTMASTYTGTALTMIAIGIVTRGDVYSRVISTGNGGANDTGAAGCFAALQQNAIPTDYQIFRAGGSSTIQTVPSTAAGLAGVWSARFDGTNGHTRLSGVDGAAYASTGAFSIINFTAGVSGTAPQGAFCAPFDVCEILFYDHNFSTGEWAAMSAYTTPYYGLAA